MKNTSTAKLTLSELRNEAKKLGISVYGTKQQLVDKILNKKQSNNAQRKPLREEGRETPRRKFFVEETAPEKTERLSLFKTPLKTLFYAALALLEKILDVLLTPIYHPLLFFGFLGLLVASAAALVKTNLLEDILQNTEKIQWAGTVVFRGMKTAFTFRSTAMEVNKELNTFLTETLLACITHRTTAFSIIGGAPEGLGTGKTLPTLVQLWKKVAVYPALFCVGTVIVSAPFLLVAGKPKEAKKTARKQGGAVTKAFLGTLKKTFFALPLSGANMLAMVVRYKGCSFFSVLVSLLVLRGAVYPAAHSMVVLLALYPKEDLPPCKLLAKNPQLARGVDSLLVWVKELVTNKKTPNFLAVFYALDTAVKVVSFSALVILFGFYIEVFATRKYKRTARKKKQMK
ncbi:MAG: uncharacterized protein A8A55_1583 [Amphiamblys sp. WSBS2006]|nr:MAG: uncharacterized protein A8A55_1583 [Amphiamblys sp. WSBS2006]